ncbi:MAG: phosphoribosyl-ATP diphosphatase [Clostridiaceae bacterium]|nr:phosphoribosyl-ATP diphosphatase [Clostridiaceae bacterium]
MENRMVENILQGLYQLVEDRRKNPVVASYTNYLQDKGDDYIARKIGEETIELILALKDKEKAAIIHETADILYHLTVAIENVGITWDEIANELRSRRIVGFH